MSHDNEKQARKMNQQGYDNDPPRCFTCVYFQRRKSHRPAMPHRIVERCTFGDFPVTYKSVCDEWRSRKGEVIE